MKTMHVLAMASALALGAGVAMAADTATEKRSTAPATGAPGTTVTTGTNRAPAADTTGTNADTNRTRMDSDRTRGSDSSGSADETPPVPGANSFTEGQARERLEDNGYTSVSPLKKDDQSIWRGTAMKAGKKVGVAVDYKGNITEAAP